MSTPTAHALFPFDNSYARELDGFYIPWKPVAVSAPRMLRFNDSLAHELRLEAKALNSAYAPAYFRGRRFQRERNRWRRRMRGISSAASCRSLAMGGLFCSAR